MVHVYESYYSTEPDVNISAAVFRSKHNKFHYGTNVNSLPTNKMWISTGFPLIHR